MAEARVQMDLLAGTSATVVFTGGGKSKVAMTLPDIAAGFEVVAVCDRCQGAVGTGRWARLGDRPLNRAGQWRHSCGGTGHMPVEYEVSDQRTQRTIDMYVVERDQIQLSVITLAELLRLSQAARAVQAGRPGADEKLERVLAEAPEPIRRLRDRLGLREWTREQKLALAGIIVTLATALLPLLKSDGAVTEQQLVEIIEQLVDQQPSDAPGEQGQPEEDAASRAGRAGAGEGGGPADAPQGGRDGGALEVQHDQGVGGPDQ